jgi:hypothetical protein
MFKECEIHLEEDLEVLSANKKLKVKFDNTILTHVDCPKYLGVILDRTLQLR